LTHLTRSRKIRRRSCSPFWKKHSKVGRNVESGVLLAKETTLKATNLNKLYLSTYNFYYYSPVFYWSYLVQLTGWQIHCIYCWECFVLPTFLSNC
jgi:hypothetical protein